MDHGDDSVEDQGNSPLVNFVGTVDFTDSLDQGTDATAAIVKAAADLAHARHATLPYFFRTLNDEPWHENTEFKQMKEMKDREERVRLRSSKDHAGNAQPQATAQAMRMRSADAWCGCPSLSIRLRWASARALLASDASEGSKQGRASRRLRHILRAVPRQHREQGWWPTWRLLGNNSDIGWSFPAWKYRVAAHWPGVRKPEDATY